MGPIKSPSETLHDFRQEPRPPLGLVNPDLDLAGGGHVIVFPASFVRRAEIARQRLVIGAELCKQFFRGNALAQAVSSKHTHVPCQIAMRHRSTKCVNTCSFQVIPCCSRLGINVKCPPMDAASKHPTRSTLSTHT